MERLIQINSINDHQFTYLPTCLSPSGRIWLKLDLTHNCVFNETPEPLIKNTQTMNWIEKINKDNKDKRLFGGLHTHTHTHKNAH